MKKLLLVATCASAVAAFGAESPVALGEVGVTAITSSTTNTIVAVSYGDLVGVGNVTASNLVKTANLLVGDLLYVYDAANFDAFELAESGGVKYWRPSTVVSPLGNDISVSESPSADSVRVAAGKGVWLVRGSNWNGNEFIFYIYGKPTTSTSVSVPASTSMLVGNPTQSNAYPTVSPSPNNGDRITLPQDGGMVTWTYNDDKSKWGARINGARQESVNPPTITAGKGFWYVTTATGGVTISW